MASDQNTNAQIKLYAQTPSGKREILFSGVNEQTGPGGSPDSVQAVTNFQDLPKLPLSNKVLPGGTKIIPVVVLSVADGIDASDCVFNVPVTDAQGNVKVLTRTDLGITTDFPASTPAGLELDLGTGYELSNNEVLRLGAEGGASYFMSVENDAA